MSWRVTDEAVEAASRAMEEFAVKEAHKIIEGLALSPIEFTSLFRRLVEEGEAAQILIYASYLETMVVELLKCQLVHIDSQNDHDRVFGSNGPLSTHGSRLLMSYQLGWLSPRTYRWLAAFKAIRNEFAHNAFKTTFNDAKIQKKFDDVDYDTEDFILSLGEDMAKYRNFTKPNIILYKMAVMMFHTARELMIYPIARSLQLSPGSIGGAGLVNAPKRLQEMTRDMCRAQLEILQRA